jgi:hypothetical protein
MSSSSGNPVSDHMQLNQQLWLRRDPASSSSAIPQFIRRGGQFSQSEQQELSLSTLTN